MLAHIDACKPVDDGRTILVTASTGAVVLVAALAGPPLLRTGGAVLPLVARNARGFALYIMASKLALGWGGLAMTAALGDRSTLALVGLTALAIGAGAGCLLAGVLLAPYRLTAAELSGARGR